MAGLYLASAQLVCSNHDVAQQQLLPMKRLSLSRFKLALRLELLVL